MTFSACRLAQTWGGSGIAPETPLVGRVVAKYPNVRYRVALAFAENQLPKLDVAGSSPVSRSNAGPNLRGKHCAVRGDLDIGNPSTSGCAVLQALTVSLLSAPE